MRSRAALLLLVGFLSAAHAQQRNESARTGDPARGKYIVERVAMCIQCHTPRTEAGDLLRDRELQGAPIPFTSPWPGSLWANTAPRIAGLPQYSREEGIRLLMTGISRTGGPLRPPMPPFRMNAQDAADVISFLKSMR